MTPAQSSSELVALIEREAAEAARLLEALLSERSALAINDSDGLAAATTKKTALLGQLEMIEKDRRRLLQRVAVGATHVEMQSYVEHLARNLETKPLSRVLRQHWQHLTTTLQQCRDLNLSNGRIVAAMQTRVQQALNLLRGGRGTVATYGRTGSTQLTGTGARELARA